MCRRVCLLALVILFLGSASHCGGKRPQPAVSQAPQGGSADPIKQRCPEKPNILLITLDTLRFDATQLDDAGHNSTPFLARLGASAANFVTSYSTHDSTPASHFSLFTGYIEGYKSEIDRPETSIAHQLRNIGYDTFGIVANGKLSNKSMRTVMRFADYDNLSDRWLAMTSEQKRGQGQELDALVRIYGDEPNDGLRGYLYSSAAKVPPLLEKRLERATAPFLGFVNLMDCHDPYYPDAAYYSREKERGLRRHSPPSVRYRKVSAELAHPEVIADERRKQFVTAKIKQAAGRAWSTTLDLDAAALQIYRMRYDAKVRELDRTVERIYSTLDRSELLHSTIVVITSDHGESFGEQQLITHSFDEQGDRESTHHVPLLIVFPPCYGFSAVKVARVCTIADIAPTLYELVGIDPKALWSLTRPGNFGRSLLPELRVTGAPSGQVIPPSTEGWKRIEPSERKQQDEEAIKRLRSLGYVN